MREVEGQGWRERRKRKEWGRREGEKRTMGDEDNEESGRKRTRARP